MKIETIVIQFTGCGWQVTVFNFQRFSQETRKLYDSEHFVKVNDMIHRIGVNVNYLPDKGCTYVNGW